MEPTWLDIYINAVQANASMPLPGVDMLQPIPYTPPPEQIPTQQPQQGIIVPQEQAQVPPAGNLNTLTSNGVPNNG